VELAGIEPLSQDFGKFLLSVSECRRLNYQYAQMCIFILTSATTDSLRSPEKVLTSRWPWVVT